MAKPKVLYICHNHPEVRPGGAEAYALELYKAVRESGEFEPFFLARLGLPFTTAKAPHEDTPLGPANKDPNQYFFYTDNARHDHFLGTSPDKELYFRHCREVLEAIRPHLVHLQHTLYWGYDLIRQIRNTLPKAPILHTLHEFLPICLNNGQMVRTGSFQLCTQASPARCHECYPERTPQEFFLRERFIKSHLALVDLFLAPSRYLLEKYVEWGIPREKILFEDYGRTGYAANGTPPEDRPRNRFGFFGQVTRFKGMDVLLRAMKLLGDKEKATGGKGGEAPSHLWLHAANLDLQSPEYQALIRGLLEQSAGRITDAGPYHNGELPGLMRNLDWVVVPSVWWENSPLVIQEAFLNGRPVLCSDVGGMAEKVADGVNGLHFRVGNPASLAEAMYRAAHTPGLWDQLRAGIPQVYKMEDHLASLARLYHAQMELRQKAKG